MKFYIGVRAEAEKMVRESGMNATILRPWYVLGPGRYWPVVLKPMYWLMERIPATRESAQRLGLVTLQQMVGALVRSIETPAHGVRILGVPEIWEILCGGTMGKVCNGGLEKTRTSDLFRVKEAL